MDARWNSTRTRTLARYMMIGLMIAAAGTTGCKHRRSSLRPVFVDQEPVLLGPSPSSATVIPTNPSPYDYDSSYADPAPGFEDTYGYVAPPAGAGPSGEPELNLSPLDEPLPEPVEPLRDENTIPSNVDAQPRDAGAPPRVDDFNLSPPTTYRNDRPGATLTSSRSDLRARVQAMADDPIDLVQPPKADRPWRYVVLHHSAAASGGYAQIDRQHREQAGLDGCSYHFVIGNGTQSPDGTIEVTRRWSEQHSGAHCRDAKHPSVNEYGIGICLVGDMETTGPTPKQVEAARALVAYLQDRYQISADRVGTHNGFSASPTVCPGNNFPTEQILGRPSLASAR